MFWIGHKAEPIGIDIGVRCMRAVQFRQRSGQLELVAAASDEFDISASPDAIGMKLEEMIRRGGFDGRSATTCMPASDLEVKAIRLPNMPLDELESAAVFEARERFGNFTDDWTLRAMPAGKVGREGDSQQEVIILAAPTETIEKRLRLLTDAGLTVVGIEPPGHAFFRPFERFLQRPEDEDIANAFLDMGRSSSRVIITRGHDIVFLKNCPIGGTTLDEAVADKLSIPLSEAVALRRNALSSDPDTGAADRNASAIEAMQPSLEQLGKEVSLCLRYYAVTFRGERPESVTCGGSEAVSSLLLDTLSEAAHLPCRVGHALRGVECSPVFSAEQIATGLPEWTTAAGLALRPRSTSHKKVKAA